MKLLSFGSISISSPDLIFTPPEPPRSDLITGQLDARVNVTPVPAPGTFSIAMAGLLLLAGALRLRASRAGSIAIG